MTQLDEKKVRASTWFRSLRDDITATTEPPMT